MLTLNKTSETLQDSDAEIENRNPEASLLFDFDKKSPSLDRKINNYNNKINASKSLEKEKIA